MNQAVLESSTQTIDVSDLREFSAIQRRMLPAPPERPERRETSRITDQELGYWIQTIDHCRNTPLVVSVQHFGGGAPHQFNAKLVFQRCVKFGRKKNHQWKQLLTELNAYRKLEQGWDGYQAPPPNLVAVINASELIDVLRAIEMYPNRVRPSVVGGIGITFRKNDKKAYIEFLNDGRVYVLFSDGVTEPTTKRVQHGYVGYLSLIRDIREYLNG